MHNKQQIKIEKEKKEIETKKKLAKVLSKMLIILIGLIVVALIFVTIYIITTFQKLGQLSYDETIEVSGQQEQIEEVIKVESSPVITTEIEIISATPTPTLTPKQEQEVINILVIGCDSKKQGQYGNARSDVNVIMSINQKNQQVKMVTFMRDSLVYYEGEEMQRYCKLNAALQYADHPQGVADTITDNFGVEIDYYMITDFWGMAELIEVFRGVEVYLTEAEISNLNDVLAVRNRLESKPVKQDFVLRPPGRKTLNGRQAVSYMRIRKIDSDRVRGDRQYEVLSALKGEISDMGLIQLNKIVQKLPRMLKTDMNEKELLSVVKILYGMKDCEMEHTKVPFDDTYEAVKYTFENNKKKDVIQLDMEKNIELIEDFLYE